MDNLEIPRRLFDGVTPEDMTHLPEVSSYNHNYYSLNGKLLFAKSDDDNFTQWYWIKGQSVMAVGGSYTSDDNRIVVDYAYT